MFDLGWTELLLIGIVALIVVGPKDLPMLFRNVGRFVGKAKGMAREFSRAMDDAAEDSGFKDAAKGFRDAADPKKLGLDKIKEATDDFKSWSPDTATGKLSEERAEAARKIHAATAQRATERKAEAAVAVKEADSVKTKGNAKPATKKPAASKSAVAKPAAKKSVAAKPATGKIAAKKTATPKVKPATATKDKS